MAIAVGIKEGTVNHKSSRMQPRAPDSTQDKAMHPDLGVRVTSWKSSTLISRDVPAEEAPRRTACLQEGESFSTRGGRWDMALRSGIGRAGRGTQNNYPQIPLHGLKMLLMS